MVAVSPEPDTQTGDASCCNGADVSDRGNPVPSSDVVSSSSKQQQPSLSGSSVSKPLPARVVCLETALEKEEEFVRALLHNLSEGIIACDDTAQLTLYNAAARRLVGWQQSPRTAEDWMADCSLITADGHELAPVENPLNRALRGESIQDYELSIVHPSGQQRQVLVNGDPIRDDGGAPLGAVIALRDITQFRQAASALREREDFLRSIYNGIETSIFVVDVEEDGSFRYVGINPAHERLTGLHSYELEGKTPAAALRPEVAAAVTERYRACVESRSAQSFEESLTLREDVSWWLTTLHPLIDQCGRVYRLIGTSINITRRKRAEERAYQLNAELEQRVADRTRELTQLNAALLQTTALLEKRNQELDQFVYVASHDLKAPLRAIANLSSWLEEDLGSDLPAENQEQMQLLRGRVNRMEALINGLLEYSRVGRKEFPEEAVDVCQLLNEVIDSLAPPATFNCEVVCDLPPVTTKRVLLHQIFANLISNAIKHCDREDCHVRIICEETANGYHFAVSDNGPGIAPEYHEKIFRVFQTLKARDRLESTGIGLSIVKKILDAEGGRVELESTLGEGTTFHIYWPRSAA